MLQMNINPPIKNISRHPPEIVTFHGHPDHCHKNFTLQSVRTKSSVCLPVAQKFNYTPTIRSIHTILWRFHAFMKIL